VQCVSTSGFWAARFFKTCTFASDSVDNGKIRLNDERPKTARDLKIGDILAVDNASRSRAVG
jgi:ribosome-associated heat shock protein Hsp15